MDQAQLLDSLVLREEGLNDATRAAVYDNLYRILKTNAESLMGFQSNMTPEFPQLNMFTQLNINNAGDPFVASRNASNTKIVEVQVLDYFARLWNIKYPHNPLDGESYWGYLLSMGATEGTLYGLWQARDYLQGNSAHIGGDENKMAFSSVHGKYTSESKVPIAFFSEATHYSIVKVCRMLCIPLFSELGQQLYKDSNPLGGEWPDAIPCDEHGAVDVEKLVKLVEFFAQKGHPPIIVMNYGTTFTGNYDDVEAVGQLLLPVLRKHGMEQRELKFQHGTQIRTGYWIHIDAALGGTYGNFIRMAQQKGDYNGVVPPKFDFSLPWVHSIGTSGHKWTGSPWPSGIFMTRVKYHLPPNGSSMVIGAPDSTLSSSRNGTSALVMWDFFAKNSYKSLENRIVESLEATDYAYSQLLALSFELGAKYEKDAERIQGEGERRYNWLWVSHAPVSLAICFRRPNSFITKKFSLATQNVIVTIPGCGKVVREMCHIYFMDHIDQSLFKSLLQHLQESNAFGLC
eukprot:Phypoly_transcript_07337.p1 GENE.Phypoly_transcript_07337~~Phypoly_transcript_07337.p1  ORF type:complete len:515 (+),score=55.59 Phypoly_transcript_07337:35-1579(+)